MNCTSICLKAIAEVNHLEIAVRCLDTYLSTNVMSHVFPFRMSLVCMRSGVVSATMKLTLEYANSPPFHKHYRQENYLVSTEFPEKAVVQLPEKIPGESTSVELPERNGNLGVALCNAGPLCTCSVLWCSAWERSSNHRDEERH